MNTQSAPVLDNLKARIDPSNPQHIPTQGNFYLHDDRGSRGRRGRGGFRDRSDGEGRVAPSTRSPTKLWEPAEPKWTHDKFEELLKEGDVRPNVIYFFVSSLNGPHFQRPRPARQPQEQQKRRPKNPNSHFQPSQHLPQRQQQQSLYIIFIYLFIYLFIYFIIIS